MNYYHNLGNKEEKFNEGTFHPFISEQRVIFRTMVSLRSRGY